MSAALKSLSRDDHDPCCTLQPVFSGKLPGVDGHHIGLRRRLNAVLFDGCATVRRVDETTSSRAAGGMALRVG